MLGVLFLLLIAIPIAELYVIVQVASGIGVIPTLALLVGISIAGGYLVRQQGEATWRRLQATLDRGAMPTAEVTDGVLILLGGALLLTPGFITDVVGLLLLLPFTRASVKGIARVAISRWARRRAGRRGIYAAEAVRVERVYSAPERGPEVTTRPEELPGRERPPGGGDSPDRG